MAYLSLLAVIVTIVTGLISIINGLRGLAKELKKKQVGDNKSILKNSFFIIFGLILIGAFFYIVHTKNIIIRHSSEREQARFELNQFRDELLNIRLEYENLEDDGVDAANLEIAGELLEKTSNSFGHLEHVYVDSTWSGLYIYKLDHLTYYATILASTESLLEGRINAIMWARRAILVSNKAIQKIQKIRTDLRNDSLNKTLLVLDDWIRSDGVENRLHFLRGLAMAIRLYCRDTGISPIDVQNEIELIDNTGYLINYPLRGNPHFERIEEQLDEDFIRIYFDFSDTSAGNG